MKYVLDACAGLQCLLVEKDIVKARKLRDDFNSGIIELLRSKLMANFRPVTLKSNGSHVSDLANISGYPCSNF